MTTLITSLNKDLFDEYGQNMISGFIEKSIDVRLIVVFEGDYTKINIPQNEKVKLLNLESPDHSYFLRTFGNLYEANGYRLIRQKGGNEQQLQLIHDFRYNLVRFSFKIFSIFIAKQHIEFNDEFAWIDADLKCLRLFSSENLSVFFPKNNQLMSYLGRTKFPPDAPYSECGFLGFNPNHPELNNFLNRMKALYMSGEAFQLEQWQDCWLWDHVRSEFSKNGTEFLNLSGKYQETEHPFINCGLGQYFDHLKGPTRKKQGHSFASDYKNNNK